MNVELAKISAKGQVVIPQKIRDELDIDRGSRLVVYVHGDEIILKKLELPPTAGISEAHGH